MLREIERRRGEAQQVLDISPSGVVRAAEAAQSVVDDIGLTETMRGFEDLEAPAGREFWGDYEHPLQSEFVRPLAAGVSALPRGVLKGALAASEVVAGRPFAPELVELEQSWKDWESGLTKGAKPEDDDIYAVLGKASEGEVTPLLSLMTRGMVQATPGMIVAIKNMPAYMGTLIGDYAQRAADDRGSESIEFNDLGRAVVMAGAEASIEKASALKALSGAGATTAPGAALRGALIEGGEEYTQKHLENIGIQAGSDRPGFLGVDWAEGHKGGIHGLAVGAPMGATMGGGAAMRRNDTIGRLGRRIADVPARREARLRQEVADLEAEAAQPPVRQDEPTGVVMLEPIAEEVVAEGSFVFRPAPPPGDPSPSNPDLSRLGSKDMGTLNREGMAYRGMTEQEYAATVARDGRVMSRGDYSFAVEGTSFAEDIETAEAYVNSGRDDPRKTGAPTYIVEVDKGLLTRDTDGYWKSSAPVPVSGRVWRVEADKGALVGTEVATPTAEVVAEEVVAEPVGPAFDPQASLEEYRTALDGRDPDPAEDIRTIEAILQRPGAGPWLGNMRNMALGRLEGDPFSERLRYGARRAEELWEQRRTAPAAEEVAETVLTVVPGAEPGAKRTLVLRTTPREQVEADTDVAVRRVEADRALAEEVAAVPTRPRTGESEPRTTQAQAQARLDQADVDVDTTASDPSASLADIVEKQARTAGLHSDANNASNEDTRAFLEEMFPDDPARVKKTMSQDRVPVSQALAELQARDLHTRTPDDFTVKTTDPFGAMLDDIIATGRDADYVEKLAFGHAKIQHRRVYKNLLQQYDKAETQAERDLLSRKIDNVREASGKIAEANALAQRAWGLAGRYSQFFLDKDLTLVEAISKAKVDNKGLGLSADQRAFIEKEYAVSTKLEARAKPIRQAAVKKMRALSRVIRRLEGKASPTKRDAKLLKEARKRYDRAEGTVVIADHDVRAAKSIRLNAIDRSRTGSVLTALGDIDDASRALRSSGEDSALGRQGMNLLARSLLTREQAWIKTIPPALKILAAAVVNNPAGRVRAKRLQQELVDQPYQAVFDLVGGQLSEVEGVGGRHGGKIDARQEEFAANLFNRLGRFGRGVGERLIEPSQNAYSLTLNMLRRHYFDVALKKRLAFSNIPTDLSATELVKAVKADPQILADLESDAYLANVFTGRGDWRIGTEGGSKGKGGKDIAARLAKRSLYAPRYMMSIIENSLRTIPSAALTGLLTRRSWTKPLRYKNYPEWFKKLKNREYDPKVLPLMMAGVGPFKNVSDYQRGRLMGEAVFETAWLSSIAALAMIGLGDDDDEVSWWERFRKFNDPSDADYHKVVFGDWHWSFEGGRGATTRHLMPYKLTQSESDDIANVSGDVDWSRRIGRLLRNKTRPLVSSVISAAANEDYLGNQVTDMEWEEAKEDVYDLMTHLGQRSIPVALAFTPIISESMGSALGEGMAETGIPGVVPSDPSMADPDAPSLLNRLLITGGSNMFGIGAQYYDAESGDASIPPELRRLLRGSDPTRLLRPPAGL